jgi:hypothetical protein
MTQTTLKRASTPEPPKRASTAEWPKRASTAEWPKRVSATELGLVCPHSRMAWAKPHHRRLGGSANAKKPQTKAIRISLGACGNPWAGRTGRRARPSLPSFLAACRPARTSLSSVAALIRRRSSDDDTLELAPLPQKHVLHPLRRAPFPLCISRSGRLRAGPLPWRVLAVSEKEVSSPDRQATRNEVQAGRALLPVWPARGNHRRPGGSVPPPLWPLRVGGSPWTPVVRLRPGHTGMRTHQPRLCCANALWLLGRADALWPFCCADALGPLGRAGAFGRGRSGGAGAFGASMLCAPAAFGRGRSGGSDTLGARPLCCADALWSFCCAGALERGRSGCAGGFGRERSAALTRVFSQSLGQVHLFDFERCLTPKDMSPPTSGGVPWPVYRWGKGCGVR